MVDWQTVRIEGLAYTQLVEIAGFLTILFQRPVSLGEAAQIAIDSFYDTNHAAMLKIISDPDALEKVRSKAVITFPLSVPAQKT